MIEVQQKQKNDKRRNMLATAAERITHTMVEGKPI